MFDYKIFTGTLAWLFHRISGLVLIFYLSLHVWVVHHLAVSPDSFNTIMKLLSEPLFKFVEVPLLGAVLYHAINGIRVILIEYPWGNKYQKELFYFSFAISTLLTLVGAWYLLGPVFSCMGV